MSRGDADIRFARLKWRHAFDKWERKAARWAELVKAGFNPNQPRVPVGRPGGGQWTSGGGGGSTGRTDRRVLSDATPGDLQKPGAQLAQAHNEKPPKIKLPSPEEPQRSGSPDEPPPKFPKKKPRTHKERLGYARRAARWLFIAVAGRQIRAAGAVLNAIHETGWMDEFRGFIQGAFDPPKPLRQLQKEAFEPIPGYDIHHIVEKTSARNAGFPQSRINAPENLVRIPRIRHWEITAWYGRQNEDYVVNGRTVSPREYLRDKDWDERRKVGLDAMRKFEVLK